jgi:Zn-dependent protease with chaperone function
VLAKALVLTRIRTILAFGGTAWTILVLLVILIWRWAAGLRNWAEHISQKRWLQGLIFLPIAIVFVTLVSLPLDIYGQHIERAYGLAVQSWASWSLDQLKALGLSLIVITPLLLLLFWIIRVSPRHWWLWFCTLPVMVFAVFISPIWIDPIFNHFSPLEKSDPALTLQLEQLAHHAGLDIPPSRMFLMRASEKVTGLNAYVTGIGATTRIVVWDNTIHKLPPDEILFVVGHEMGHYVLHHIYIGIAFTMAVLIVLLWLAWLAVNALIRRFGAHWEIRAPGDWAALAVLLLVFTGINFLFSPIANAFSRWEEHQADVFGQEAIHSLVPDPQITAQKAFVALGENYLEAPNPNSFVEFWLYSHPSISHRANFAAHYDPWLPAHHPKYFPR